MNATKRPRPAGLLLAPGAGSSSDHPALLAVETALAPLPVRRMDFPYRLAGRRAPDRPPVLLGAVRAELEDFTEELGEPADSILMGGRSMGGRICSMVVAEDGVGRGLVLISYPLHPPGRPERLRTEHLSRLELPCLFVSGDRDPFGTPDELRTAFDLIPGDVTFHVVTGGRHELKGADAEVAEVVAGWARSLG